MAEDEGVDWQELDAEADTGGEVEPAPGPETPSPEANGETEEEENSLTAADLQAVFDIPVKVSAILGKCDLQVSQLMKLSRGAVIELDRKVGEAIDVYVNNRLIARGEVVLVDERLGITMTEIVKGGQ